MLRLTRLQYVSGIGPRQHRRSRLLQLYVASDIDCSSLKSVHIIDG